MFLLSTAFAFLDELQQADLITSEECEELSDISDVVAVQSGKSPAVMTKTTAVLRRLGFEKESRLLTGTYILVQSHLPVLCCTVEPPYDGHLVTSTTVH